MAAAGFTVAGEEHAICPVMLWEEQTNQQMAREMLEEGVLVIPLSFPVVARGKARIRVQVIASHPFLLLLSPPPLYSHPLSCSSSHPSPLPS